MNIEAGEGYRLLQIGETILEGDEFSNATSPTGWSRVVSNFGYVVQPFHMLVRRKHPAPAPAGWIKCSERLPEKAGMYLCFLPSDSGSGFRLNDWMVNPGRWGTWKSVTHWMPLLSPPEPEESAAEKAADRYVESLLAPPDRSNAKRDFMAGWEAGKL